MDDIDLDVRVERRVDGADGIVVLDLVDPTGRDLPSWQAGAHIDLALPGELNRQYSLCGDVDDLGTWRIAVLREPDGRGGSAYIHDHLVPGAVVHVQGLRNHFMLRASTHYVFVAGGIGITPILPMLRAAALAGSSWELHYGGRQLASMAFRDELAQAPGGQVTLHPQEQVGLMDLDAILGAPRAGTTIYCCGPEPLLNAVEERVVGWPEGSLQVERFAPKDVGEPVFDGSFEVELASSGEVLTVPPDRSVLEVLEDAGVPVLSSCQDGTCGTCETPVLSGEVDHRDSLLTPAEQAANTYMYVCVSRAACPRLLLDL